jgi:hypothetical protein
MRLTWLPLLLLVSSQAGLAQLTPDQKLVDFQQLVALFSKRYAFLEWKRDAISYDGLKLAPWIERIKASRDDMDYLEICIEYVAAFRDGHTGFEIPSTFSARLGFTADQYDDRILIDTIDRKKLPEADFPVQIGDELVSIDGKTPATMMADVMRFIGEGNPRTARRVAAALMTTRLQYYGPRAYQLPDQAQVVVRRQSGSTETYTVAWDKEGMAFTHAGPVPDPTLKDVTRRAGTDSGFTPSYLRRLRALQTLRARRQRFSLASGQLQPAFTIDGFTQRLGKGRLDTLYTGTFQAGGMTFGFLRVSDFEYISTSDLEREIAYFQANTDGLVIDVMGNPGGYGCEAEDLMAHLMPNGYQSLGNSIRATWEAILVTQDEIDLAGYYEADEEDITALQNILVELERAYEQSRGFTAPLPVCGNSRSIGPTFDKKGNNIAYTKPILVLVDELSTSAAELFAAVMQDEKRALIYGLGTGGAGGSVDAVSVGFYTEGGSSLAESILVRDHAVTSAEYPASPYIENIGVRPEKKADFMTVDNLLNHGKAFVSGFSDAMVEYVKSQEVKP